MNNFEYTFLHLPNANEYFPNYVERIHKLLNVNKAEKKHLLGFSMGGRIAFYLKVMFPSSYDKVVLLSAQAINFEGDNRLKIDQTRFLGIKNEDDFTRWTKNFFNAPLYGKIYDHPRFQEKKTKIKFSHIDRYQHFFDFLSVSRQPTLTGQDLHNLKNIYYLYGEHDSKFKEIGKKLKNVISNLQTFSIANAHHAAHIENPFDVFKIIQKIFNNQPSSN